MASASTAPSNAFKEYLNRPEADLLKFHPLVFYTNEEIKESKDLLKRDSTPICIPPSWDLVQKYAGALDEKADGYDGDLYEKGKRNFVGDQGEAKFLDAMRNLEIGGILIGDVNSQHVVYGEELADTKNEYYMLPSQVTRQFKKGCKQTFKSNFLFVTAQNFQFDFLYVDPEIGLIHIEIKNTERPTEQTIKANFEQIIKQRKKLIEIFEVFCQCLGEENHIKKWSEFFIANSVLMHSNDFDSLNIDKDTRDCVIVNNIINYTELLTNLRISVQNDGGEKPNLLKDEIFRQFIIFLIGYRPNFFISPVQCALQVHKNIFTHHINTVNYYSKNKEGDFQNDAKSTKEFLQELKFVKYTEINFGKHKNIYLTKEQMTAVGKLDGEGSFSPRLQLILGSPGSGKSLLLMIKMFICGQMEQRKDRPIIYSSRTGDDPDTQTGGFRGPGHQQKLAAFIESNRSAFCREFSYGWIRRTEDMNELNADYFVDEDIGLASLQNSALLKDSGQMITVICTGLYGEALGLNHCLRSGKPNFGFECVTQLRIVFRSSRQIQRYFFEHSNLKASISLDSLSGHNYNGVKVEIHDLPNFESGLRFVEERLMKLVGTEGCRETDIGLVYDPLIDGKYKKYEQIKQIDQRICQRFTNISVYDYHLHVPSLEFPVMLIVDEPSNSRRRFLLASRAICHLIVCNVIKAH